MKSICELLSIRYPIIQGGMGNISHAALTAAVLFWKQKVKRMLRSLLILLLP